jgi:hypothetical protein
MRIQLDAWESNSRNKLKASPHEGGGVGPPPTKGRAAPLPAPFVGFLYGGWLSVDMWDIGQCRNNNFLF